MCTLALFFQVFPNYPIVIAANRDEALDRPSLGPTQLSSSPWIYGGQDLLAGGTWLGINECGVAVGVLNRQSSAPADSSYRSRGQLCLEALQCHSAESAVNTIVAQREHCYNPFNLVISDHTAAYVVDNQTQTLRIHQLSPGIHIITNRAPNDLTCSRISRFLPLFTDLGHSAATSTLSLSNLFSALQRQMAQHAEASEEARSGLCLHMDGYGTCSSTLLAYSHTDRCYNYHFAPGPPCQTDYKEVSLPLPAFANHPPSTT